MKQADGPHSLDLHYQIGGPELVYKGLDGDEFHTKATRDGTGCASKQWNMSEANSFRLA